MNDIKSAIKILVRTNELYFAYHLSKTLYKPALKEVAILLSSKAERFFQIDLALKIIKDDVQDSEFESFVIRRLTNLGLIKKVDGWKETDFKLMNEGMTLFK